MSSRYEESATSGLLRAARSLCDGVLGSVQSRLELISIELQEEKYRLIQIFIWISAAVFAGVMSLTFLSLTLVYVFWETARLWVLAALAIVYTTALIVIVVKFKSYLARQPKPFAATIDEIREDRQCISGKS